MRADFRAELGNHEPGGAAFAQALDECRTACMLAAITTALSRVAHDSAYLIYRRVHRSLAFHSYGFQFDSAYENPPRAVFHFWYPGAQAREPRLSCPGGPSRTRCRNVPPTFST